MVFSLCAGVCFLLDTTGFGFSTAVVTEGLIFVLLEVFLFASISLVSTFLRDFLDFSSL